MDNLIKELKLQLGKKEVALTMEQAKKLKEALDELFGKEVIKEVHHHDHDYRYWWQPWYLTGTIHQTSPHRDVDVWGTNVCQAAYDSGANALTLKVA
jgi:hypothetical protein